MIQPPFARLKVERDEARALPTSTTRQWTDSAHSGILEASLRPSRPGHQLVWLESRI